MSWDHNQFTAWAVLGVLGEVAMEDIHTELASMENQWTAQKVEELPPHLQKKFTLRKPIDEQIERQWNRRREDTKLVWQHLMACGGYKVIWKDFERFVRDMGLTPSPRHILSKKDFGKAHGPRNSYWKEK